LPDLRSPAAPRINVAPAWRETLGEYHYDCPLDNQLFSFKGINGEQFKTAVQAAKNYEEVGIWLQANGTTEIAG